MLLIISEICKVPLRKKETCFLWSRNRSLSDERKLKRKHLKENLSHKFSWKILFAAPENKRICKILEASEIALKRPSLNKQIESKKLLLFRNGVT